jgi:hypothetical protein
MRLPFTTVMARGSAVDAPPATPPIAGMEFRARRVSPGQRKAGASLRPATTTRLIRLD